MRNIIDTGLKKIEVEILGKGEPVLILPGLSSFADEWELVSSKLSAFAQVIVIHRSGYGHSEIGDGTHGTLETAEDIRSLLYTLDISRSVIMIGHSYGGFCAQRFGMEYPDLVHALVLVESNSVDFELLDEYIGPQLEQWSTRFKQMAEMDEEMIKGEVMSQLLPHHQQLSEGAKKRILQHKQNPLMYKAMAEEIDEMSSSAAFMKRNAAPMNLPLTVIGRDPHFSITSMLKQGIPEQQAQNIERVWQKLIKDQLKLSTQSRYVMAGDSGHGDYVDNPEVIVREVRALLSEIKS